jgi:cytochrome c oxidase assembly protein subunit 11
MPNRTNNSLALNLFALAAGMLMLAYAAVPLYDLFCRMTGYGGTPQQAASAGGKVVDRTLIVEFDAQTDPHLSWDFAPGVAKQAVKVGERTLTHYVAHNRENRPLTGRAVYNVVPFAAGAYFTKIECFCFSEQTLAAGQRVNMPISYFIDPAIMDDPEMKNVGTITLSYTFFEVKNEFGVWSLEFGNKYALPYSKLYTPHSRHKEQPCPTTITIPARPTLTIW